MNRRWIGIRLRSEIAGIRKGERGESTYVTCIYEHSLSTTISLSFFSGSGSTAANLMMILRTAFRTSTRRFLPVGSRAMSSLPFLPLTPPTEAEEQAAFNARVADMEAFFNQHRFASLKRPYTAAQVASKQGSLPVLPLPSTLLANKLYGLFEKAAAEGRPVHTMGAIDPVQMTQMAPHQEVVYVSGWACSSVLTTGNNDVGPDLGYVADCLLFSFLCSS